VVGLTKGGRTGVGGGIFSVSNTIQRRNSKQSALLKNLVLYPSIPVHILRLGTVLEDPLGNSGTVYWTMSFLGALKKKERIKYMVC